MAPYPLDQPMALRMLNVATGYSNSTQSCSDWTGNTLVMVSDRYDAYLRRYERVKQKMSIFAKILPLTWSNEIKCWPRTKNNMCIREIPSRRIDCFFFAKVYDNQGPIARGSYQPPSTALAKVAKYGSWARVKFIHCCGHCIHFVISVNDMPPSNLNIKRIVRIKRWERREANPHPQTSVSQVRRRHHYTTADLTGSVLER